MGTIVSVNFRGDDLYGFENDDGVFVALKPIVESMGMDWSAQLQRVKRDPILSEGMVIMTTPFGRGGAQDAVCLKLELVNGWLFTIDTSRIKDDAVREKVIVYQRECYGVLAKHFLGKAAGVSAEKSGDIVDDPHENESVKLRMVNESRQVFGTQAAAQLWFRLGLPVVPAMQHDPRQLSFIDYDAIKSASGSPAA
ncbi:phage antirepressor N-terminal domain-containing protein [Shinella daejeonensis]|uniref:phage antirepressor N-terminal domain-containing protein n=1 Tax=Shinella daejeonensis TaxID=659017 RepID=UPI0020C75A23|nr:phage antirepressor N-terminal domain-containing protein [Shinella daejeonensis]MCP8895360.1 phage antirepressor N-terminal domain-containing protein [Shinella daejeonensis]